MVDKLSSYIDHTILNPDATKQEVTQVIREAEEYEFASVCINPHWVKYSAKKLKDTNIKVCTVIGFPLGATSTATKVFECQQAIKDGATEVDIVLNVGELKSGNHTFVKNDLTSVVQATKESITTKVIIETSLLTKEEKIKACQLAEQAGADFVKTSTGFSGGGATVEDVELMRNTVSSSIGIKASGGIRNLETMQAMIHAGATRIGASAGVSIMKECAE